MIDFGSNRTLGRTQNRKMFSNQSSARIDQSSHLETCRFLTTVIRLIPKYYTQIAEAVCYWCIKAFKRIIKRQDYGNFTGYIYFLLLSPPNPTTRSPKCFSVLFPRSSFSSSPPNQTLSLTLPLHSLPPLRQRPHHLASLLDPLFPRRAKPP